MKYECMRSMEVRSRVAASKIHGVSFLSSLSRRTIWCNNKIDDRDPDTFMTMAICHFWDRSFRGRPVGWPVYREGLSGWICCTATLSRRMRGSAETVERNAPIYAQINNEENADFLMRKWYHTNREQDTMITTRLDNYKMRR